MSPSRMQSLAVGLGLVAALIAGTAVAAPAAAEAGKASPLPFEDRINAVLANPQSLEKAKYAGKKAAFFCLNCHGENGISAFDYIPNLAGQNAVYLLHQIQKFGDGRRKDEFMSGLIKVLKEEDRFNMAIYYATLPVKPGAAKDARQVEQGRQVFNRSCQGCHGAEGRGSKTIARLAGQQPVYITRSLVRYRDGKGERMDPAMTAVARRMSDADMAAVAAFLNTMP